jgi:hypothetical protein
VLQRARLLSKTARRSEAVMHMLESRELVGELGRAEIASIGPGIALGRRGKKDGTQTRKEQKG